MHNGNDNNRVPLREQPQCCKSIPLTYELIRFTQVDQHLELINLMFGHLLASDGVLGNVVSCSIYIIAPRSSSPKKIYVTLDDGNTWKSAINSYDYTPNGYCITDSTCYLLSVPTGRAYHILKTSDRGQSWVKVIASSLPGTAISSGTYDSGIYCIDDKTCLFGFWDSLILAKSGFKSSQLTLKIQKDGASTIPRITAVECLKRTTVCLVAVKFKYRGAIYRSADSGQSWSRVYNYTSEIEDMSCVSIPKGDSFCVVAGERGALSVSTNHGNTWKYVPYKFDKEYFFPFCKWSLANCILPKKVDSISCLEPYHCVIGIKGFDTTYDEEQNGALCMFIKYKHKEATVSCLKLSRYNKGVKVHCSSYQNCMAITQERYNRYTSKGTRYLVYEATIYRYDPESKKWKSLATKPKDTYGHFQNMIGSHFTYKENFDFASDGGGVNSAVDILPGNIAVYLELLLLLYLIL